MKLEMWREGRALRRQKRQLAAAFPRVRDAAEESERSRLIAEYSIADRAIQVKLLGLQTRKLNLKALKLGVEIPSEWYSTEYVSEKNYTQAHTYLSPFAQTKARKLIRTEQRNNAQFWINVLVPLITAATGLAGAAIGLIAVLWK